jgi:hypothetical protein
MAEEKQPTAATPALRKHITSEEFITDWPLYTVCEIEEGFAAPTRISYECDTPGTCGKETTWVIVKDNPRFHDLGKGHIAFYSAQYICMLCYSRDLTVMYREVETKMKTRPRRASSIGGLSHPIPLEERVVTKVQKIGQYPPLSIRVSKPLEKNLGKEHTALYKKALINRNAGHGLAAVSYIRRVVEDKTEELIEAVAQLAESHQIDPKTVGAIRAAKVQKTTYDEKLKIGSTVMPKSMLIEGVNPLEVLYGLVSMGLHNLTEEQCIDIADEGKSAFEYTFANLRAETDGRKDFADTIKKLERKLSALKTPKSEAPE